MLRSRYKDMIHADRDVSKPAQLPAALTSIFRPLALAYKLPPTSESILSSTYFRGYDRDVSSSAQGLSPQTNGKPARWPAARNWYAARTRAEYGFDCSIGRVYRDNTCTMSTLIVSGKLLRVCEQMVGLGFSVSSFQS